MVEQFPPEGARPHSYTIANIEKSLFLSIYPAERFKEKEQAYERALTNSIAYTAVTAWMPGYSLLAQHHIIQKQDLSRSDRIASYIGASIGEIIRDGFNAGVIYSTYRILDFLF